MLHSICQQIWKMQQWPQDWKKSVFHSNPKECSNYCTIALISHASKVMLKILQARLQQYMNSELPDVQAGFRKGRGTRDQIVNICWIIKKARETQWTWVRVDSGSWWWTGRLGVLRFMGSERVGHDRVTELNWTEGGTNDIQLNKLPFLNATNENLHWFPLLSFFNGSYFKR